MKEDELIRSAAAAVAAEAMLQPEQIPAIDLYMDQVITVLEQGIGRSGREADERPMTKAMINNYTKGGVIRPLIMIMHIRTPRCSSPRPNSTPMGTKMGARISRAGEVSIRAPAIRKIMMTTAR